MLIQTRTPGFGRCGFFFGPVAGYNGAIITNLSSEINSVAALPPINVVSGN